MQAQKPQNYNSIKLVPKKHRCEKNKTNKQKNNNQTTEQTDPEQQALTVFQELGVRMFLFKRFERNQYTVVLFPLTSVAVLSVHDASK